MFEYTREGQLKNDSHFLPHVDLFDVAANSSHTSTFEDVTDDLGALGREIEIMRGRFEIM